MCICTKAQLPFIEVNIAEEYRPNGNKEYCLKIFRKLEDGGVERMAEIEISGLKSINEAEKYIECLRSNYNVAHLRCIEYFRLKLGS